MITIVGAGYVGLVTGSCFADWGAEVVFHDGDVEKVAALQNGFIPIFEPGLREVFERNQKSGRITVVSSPAEAFGCARWAFVTVGTPALADGSCDLSQVLAAVRSAAEHAPQGMILVLKSTVPVGTADLARAILREAGRDDIPVVSNPEFMREGQAVHDFKNPDRVVVGSDDREAGERVLSLYRHYLKGYTPMFLLDNRSAEIVKYASNAYLAMRISFINEIANLCERFGADIENVRLVVGSDKRIGSHFFKPGVGYGGSCFPKDVRSLIHLAASQGYEPWLISAVHEVNEMQKRRLAQKMRDHFGGELAGREIAVWGLSFKANTDDIRESPSIALIDELLAERCHVRVFDPASSHRARDQWETGVMGCATLYDAVDGADALAVMTDWGEFKLPDWARVRRLMRGAVVFDGRNLYRSDELISAGFTHISIGRPPAYAPAELGTQQPAGA